jgi:protein TonB
VSYFRRGRPGEDGRMRMMRRTGTANDAFKRTYANNVAIGISVAVLVHFAVFALFPRMQPNDLGAAVRALAAIELPPEVTIPPPPEQIARPATPRVAAAEIDDNVTIAPTTFETNPVENLPPPPNTADPSTRPSFIPYTQAPQLKNREEVLTFLRSTYPSMLRQAGIGGTVLLWLYIDAGGTVLRTVLAESSGHEALDDAAKKVAERMQFQPALNRDKKTAVWLAQSIDFAVT